MLETGTKTVRLRARSAGGGRSTPGVIMEFTLPTSLRDGYAGGQEFLVTKDPVTMAITYTPTGAASPIDDEKKVEAFQEMAQMIGNSLSKRQQDRFESITTRIFKKAEQSFGNTIEDIWQNDPHPSELLEEDVAQELEINSRGMLWRVRISVTRLED